MTMPRREATSTDYFVRPSVQCDSYLTPSRHLVLFTFKDTSWKPQSRKKGAFNIETSALIRPTNRPTNQPNKQPTDGPSDRPAN